MASALKATQAIAKDKGKSRAVEDDAGETSGSRPKAVSRKDKVLMLCSRGVTQRMRHLMGDLEALLPHTKKDAKLDSKSSLHLINELADLHSCSNAIYLEARRHADLYMWVARTPNGPSAKFHVQNLHTMDELKMTGNCLKGSRGLCVFDKSWEEGEEWALMREMLAHVFSVPKTSRRLKPFIDHILLFSVLDGKIWFRTYQIIHKDPLPSSSSSGSAAAAAAAKGKPQPALVEIGPRFVLTPIRIFEGAFGGPTVYANSEFVSPASVRASVKKDQGAKYRVRKAGEGGREERRKRQREELGEDELSRKRVFA